MKKWIFWLALVVGSVLLMGFASAITSSMKDTYQPGESAIAEISGSITEPIPLGNVQFLRGHVSVPFDYDLKKIGDKYYIWFNNPTTANNYTLIIKDISTSVAGSVQKVDYKKNFSVSGGIIDYSIKPGIILTSTDFNIIVQLNTDSQQAISVSFPSESSVTLNPGENKIGFSIAGVNGTSAFAISLGRYSVPVYIIKNETSMTPAVQALKFIPKSIKRSVLLGDTLIYQIELRNSGLSEIDNISIIYDGQTFSVSPQTDNLSIAGGGSFIFNLSIMTNSQNSFSGIIYADSGDISVGLPIDISFAANSSELPTNYSANVGKGTLYYCSELQGIVCSTQEDCSGRFEDSIEGRCCVDGKCTEAAAAATNYAWIGYVIAAIVLAGAVWLYMRYRKARPNKNILEKNIAKGEEKKFEFKKANQAG